MSVTTPPQAPGVSNEVFVQIDDVDTTTMVAHVTTKTGTKTAASYAKTSNLVQIPLPGEIWSAQRVGWQLYLDKRLDSTAENSFTTSLQPGEGRLLIPGTLHMALGGAQINGAPFGATARDVFYPTAHQRAWTLSAPPVHLHTVQVMYNGLLLDPNLWRLSSRTLTILLTTPPNGEIVVTYQRLSGYVYEDGALVIGSMLFAQVRTDSATVSGSMKAFRSPVDTATVSGTGVASSVNIAGFVDSGNAAGYGAASAVEVFIP